MWILPVSFRLNIHKEKVHHCFTFPPPSPSLYEAESRCGMCVTLCLCLHNKGLFSASVLKDAFPFLAFPYIKGHAIESY